MTKKLVQPPSSGERRTSPPEKERSPEGFDAWFAEWSVQSFLQATLDEYKQDILRADSDAERGEVLERMTKFLQEGLGFFLSLAPDESLKKNYGSACFDRFKKMYQDFLAEKYPQPIRHIQPEVTSSAQDNVPQELASRTEAREMFIPVIDTAYFSSPMHSDAYPTLHADSFFRQIHNPADIQKIYDLLDGTFSFCFFAQQEERCGAYFAQLKRTFVGNGPRTEPSVDIIGNSIYNDEHSFDAILSVAAIFADRQRLGNERKFTNVEYNSIPALYDFLYLPQFDHPTQFLAKKENASFRNDVALELSYIFTAFLHNPTDAKFSFSPDKIHDTTYTFVYAFLGALLRDVPVSFLIFPDNNRKKNIYAQHFSRENHVLLTVSPATTERSLFGKWENKFFPILQQDPGIFERMIACPPGNIYQKLAIIFPTLKKEILEQEKQFLEAQKEEKKTALRSTFVYAAREIIVKYNEHVDTYNARWFHFTKVPKIPTNMNSQALETFIKTYHPNTEEDRKMHVALDTLLKKYHNDLGKV